MLPYFLLVIVNRCIINRQHNILVRFTTGLQAYIGLFDINKINVTRSEVTRCSSILMSSKINLNLLIFQNFVVSYHQIIVFNIISDFDYKLIT